MQTIFNLIAMLFEMLAKLGLAGNSFFWWHEPELPEEWQKSELS